MELRSFGLPVLVATAVATFAAGCQSSGEIRVLTYNVHGLPDIITGDDTEARMLAISPRLNEFDLAAIQENFFYSTALSGSVEGRFAYHFTERKPGTIAPGGLSVYSVLPAGETGGDPWEACNGYLDAANDCLASKGFQFLRIVLPFTAISFDVYNLHMDAGGSAADDVARAAQAEQLLAAIEAQSAGRAVMVLGDFNLSIDDPEDVPILDAVRTGAGLTDACTAVACPEPDHIDQLFYRSGAATALTITSWTRDESFVDESGTPLSDHSAIVFGVGYAPAS